MPQIIRRDGFTAQSAVFAGSAVGVLLDGRVAAQAAKRYHLSREKPDLSDTAHERFNLINGSITGFSRRLADDQQSLRAMGITIFIVAREGKILGDKTLLACEAVYDEDLPAIYRANP